MSISVVKNGGVLYTAATITYVNEISGYGSFYPGEAAAARYDIIANSVHFGILSVSRPVHS